MIQSYGFTRLEHLLFIFCHSSKVLRFGRFSHPYTYVRHPLFSFRALSEAFMNFEHYDPEQFS